MEEGEGSSEMEFMNIGIAADSLDCSAIFHIVTDVLGFILFMHQQIPSVLQDITQEFDELRTEFSELVINSVFDIPPIPRFYAKFEKLLNPAPATTFVHLDATTVLSRGLAAKGL